MKPIWDNLAYEMGTSHDILIARIDATIYDGIGGNEIRSYPTLKYFPSNNKQGIPYNHSRSLEALIKFIHKEAT